MTAAAPPPLRPADHAELLAEVPGASVFVDGRFVAAPERRTILGKADEAPIHDCGMADGALVDAAVQAARRAFGPWSRAAPAERARALLALASGLEQRQRAFVALESHHAGKTVADAELDVRSAVATLRWFAAGAERLDGRLVAGASTLHRYVRREPLGVCALIVPWNFPLLLMLWKVAPALAAGNTVVVKPASLTPLSALAFAALAAPCGLPPGVLNVLPGAGASVGAALAAHPDVAKVSFTGSTDAGVEVARAAAGGVKRLTLELGGKSAAIVCDDADVERAAAGVAAGCFGHAGQKCAARTRCVVMASVADELVERVAARAAALRIGDPMDAAVTLGPVIDRAAQRSILAHCDDGVAQGARLVCGGRAPAGLAGPFVEATVFDHVDNGMRIAREEIFGPVLSVIRVRTLDEAVAVANDSRYGLAATVWTRSLSRAHRLAAELEAGTVSVNTPAVIGIETPFGGFKQSGHGRELGSEGFDAYTQTKSVIMDLG